MGVAGGAARPRPRYFSKQPTLTFGLTLDVEIPRKCPTTYCIFWKIADLAPCSGLFFISCRIVQISVAEAEKSVAEAVVYIDILEKRIPSGVNTDTEMCKWLFITFSASWNESWLFLKNFESKNYIQKVSMWTNIWSSQKL